MILTVNAGSSSLRLVAFGNERGLKQVAGERVEAKRAGAEALRDFLQKHALSSVSLVAHRVVHGGQLVAPHVIDTQVEQEIERFAPFAPLHNPAALEWIRRCRELLGPDIPQIAVFDTAFFADLPDVARNYALPQELTTKDGLKRYGFHGIAHCSMWRRWCAVLAKPEAGREISLQLGAGCSIAAVRDGRAIDTSMGFSPLEGLVMATRSGDLDPGLIIYLQRTLRWPPERIDELLNERSGLLGVSGLSADMRDLLESDAPAARLAIDLFCYRARKYVGAYLAALGGADAILFGGGVGEQAWQVRERILEGLEWAGLLLDPVRNRAATGSESRISAAQSKIEVWVIPVDEAAILAKEAQSVIGAAAA